MRTDIKAFLVEQATKLASDLIRASALRPRAYTPPPSPPFGEEQPSALKEAPPEAEIPEPIKPSTSPTEVITRPGIDAERLAWQDSAIRAELWLLEGHLKNNCIGCGGDFECCFKHCQNIVDASRETQSMTTDPLYNEAIMTAETIRTFVHPDDVKSGKFREQYPSLAIETSKVRTVFDQRLMRSAGQTLTLEEAKRLAAEAATQEVERRYAEEPLLPQASVKEG